MYVTQNLFYYFFFTLFRTLASFAVPMFFMFTGIFLLNNKKDNNYFEFVKKIIKKLILPLLIISIIYYLYDCLVSISISFSLKNFIINLYSNSIKYHLWYMYSIILIYFLIPFIKIGIQRMKQNELKNLIMLLFVLTTIPITINQFLIYFNIRTLDSIRYPEIFAQINYLLLGYYLYKYKISAKTKRKIYFLGVLSPILILIFDILLYRGFCWEPFFRPETIFVFFMTITIFIFVKDNYSKWKIPQKFQKFFYRVSLNAFNIYLLHVLILESSRKIIFHFICPNTFIQNVGICFLLFVITCVCSFIISCLLNNVVLFLKNAMKKSIKNE